MRNRSPFHCRQDENIEWGDVERIEPSPSVDDKREQERIAIAWEEHMQREKREEEERDQARMVISMERKRKEEEEEKDQARMVISMERKRREEEEHEEMRARVAAPTQHSSPVIQMSPEELQALITATITNILDQRENRRENQREDQREDRDYQDFANDDIDNRLDRMHKKGIKYSHNFDRETADKRRKDEETLAHEILTRRKGIGTELQYFH